MKKYILIALLINISWLFSNTLDIVTLEYPPYIYQERGIVKGVSVEIIKEAFIRMNIPFKITIMPWIRAMKQMKTGESDAVFTIYKTREREEFLYYSNEVVIDQTVSFFVKADSEIKYKGSLEDLREYRIGIVRGVSYGSVFDNGVLNGTLSKIVTVDSGEQSFLMLLRNRIDIVVSNRHGAYTILNRLKKSSGVKELLPEIEFLPSYIGFSRKKNLQDIRDKFDKVLKKMKEDGSYNRIIELNTMN